MAAAAVAVWRQVGGDGATAARLSGLWGRGRGEAKAREGWVGAAKATEGVGGGGGARELGRRRCSVVLAGGSHGGRRQENLGGRGAGRTPLWENGRLP